MKDVAFVTEKYAFVFFDLNLFNFLLTTIFANIDFFL